uniref:Lipoprotein n=1 Tax=Streptomyces sp. NBC_00049 TaxID=2903617 RepID=A0AAU2JUY5_9ACTN
MRTALVRRSVLTASAVSLALLATACGADKADTKTDAKPSAAATSAAPAAKGKTDAELAKVLVAQADLADHTFKEATPAEATAGASATSDKPECTVLVRAQSMAAAGTPSGTARTKAIATPKPAAEGASEEEKLKAIMGALGGTATAVTLASYDGKGAEEAMAAAKTASEKCAGGYGATQGGESGKITKVAPGAALTAGDEVLALTVEGDADGEKLTTQLVFVRKGNTVATFSALSLAGTAEQPKAVVEAQVKKLG